MSDHYPIDYKLARQAEPVYEKLLACTTHEEVLEVMTGVPYNVFVFLDEKNGYFGGNRAWHARLRQVRNNRGNDLFERLAP